MDKAPEHFDLREMARYYEDAITDLDYPRKPEKPSEKDYKTHAAYGQALDDYEGIVLQAYKEACKKYNEMKSEITEMFRVDLLERLEISEHSKAGKLYEMAWESGHSSGFSEIADIASELVELLK